MPSTSRHMLPTPSSFRGPWHSNTERAPCLLLGPAPKLTPNYPLSYSFLSLFTHQTGIGRLTSLISEVRNFCGGTHLLFSLHKLSISWIQTLFQNQHWKWNQSCRKGRWRGLCMCWSWADLPAGTGNHPGTSFCFSPSQSTKAASFCRKK